MNLLQEFQQHFKNNFSIFFAADTKFFVAVSGGVDSVVLVDLLAKSNIDFAIAHCNFKLRGEESNRDENFVKILAVKYSKEFFVQHFDTEKYALENKLSIQVAARELRYNWFKQIQNNDFPIYNLPLTPNHYLATAHHSNDNLETVLFNFFRGTGIQGLTGIKTIDKERKIIRPLLNFSKEEIINYATKNNLEFVEDSSNASNKYTRNNFRNAIIPMVTKHFPLVEENILNNINKMSEVEELYYQAIEKHKQNLLEIKGAEVHIPILKLKKATPLNSIIYEIIKAFSFNAAQTNEVVKLLDAHNGSYIQSATHRIINNRNWLIITPIKEAISQHFIIEKEDKIVKFNNCELRITNYELDKQETAKQTTPNTKHQTENNKKQEINNEKLDLDKLEFPLLLRKWKQGDYFYPLGMTKKQKLSKFFINQKLSVIDKENVWVIESNKKIVYIVGYRIDNRYKLLDTTKNILEFTYLK